MTHKPHKCGRNGTYGTLFPIHLQRERMKLVNPERRFARFHGSVIDPVRPLAGTVLNRPYRHATKQSCRKMPTCARRRTRACTITTGPEFRIVGSDLMVN
jgi:hypothetical protein